MKRQDYSFNLYSLEKIDYFRSSMHWLRYSLQKCRGMFWNEFFWPTVMQFGRNTDFPDEVLAYLSMFMLNITEKFCELTKYMFLCSYFRPLYATSL